MQFSEHLLSVCDAHGFILRAHYRLGFLEIYSKKEKYLMFSHHSEPKQHIFFLFAYFCTLHSV